MVSDVQIHIVHCRRRLLASSPLRSALHVSVLATAGAIVAAGMRVTSPHLSNKRGVDLEQLRGYAARDLVDFPPVKDLKGARRCLVAAAHVRQGSLVWL